MTKEPNCGSTQLAHDHGREPLPCFTDYPGTDIRPAQGAAYEPPKVVVKLTRLKPDPGFVTHGCQLAVDLDLTNYLTAAMIPKGSKLVPTALKGNPFLPEETAVPPLGPNQSVELTLKLQRFKPFAVPGNEKHGTMGIEWWDWWALYRSGKGPLRVYLTTTDPVPNPIGYQAQPLSCGRVEKPVEIPESTYWYKK